MAEKIAILGAGSWGSILASVLDENGSEVRIWSYNPEQVKELNEKHTNKRYVKDYTYSESIVAYSDIEIAIEDADDILFVVPTQVTRSVARQVGEIMKRTGQKATILHASKGIEEKTYDRLSQVLAEEIAPENRDAIAVLSGQAKLKMLPATISL